MKHRRLRIVADSPEGVVQLIDGAGNDLTRSLDIDSVKIEIQQHSPIKATIVVLVDDLDLCCLGEVV
jgi:hypothetical protein